MENKTESIGVKVVKGKTIRRVHFAPMVEVTGDNASGGSDVVEEKCT